MDQFIVQFIETNCVDEEDNDHYNDDDDDNNIINHLFPSPFALYSSLCPSRAVFSLCRLSFLQWFSFSSPGFCFAVEFPFLLTSRFVGQKT
jgi:hypothetical protein